MTASYDPEHTNSIKLRELHIDLGIPRDYAKRRGLTLFSEACELTQARPSYKGSPVFLTPQACTAWESMLAAASQDEVELSIVSGFRSYQGQADLIRSRLIRGISIEQILTRVAAPGYSEHHLGSAIDIATVNYDYKVDNFEHTDAFKWLEKHAIEFGFSMSFPACNRAGFVYEPWHWLFKQ